MRKNSLPVCVRTAVLLVACTAAASDRLDVKQVMGDFGLSADAAARIRAGEMVQLTEIFQRSRASFELTDMSPAPFRKDSGPLR